MFANYSESLESRHCAYKFLVQMYGDQAFYAKCYHQCLDNTKGEELFLLLLKGYLFCA